MPKVHDKLIENFLSQGLLNSEDAHVAVTILWLGMSKQNFLSEAKGLFLKKLLLIRELIFQKGIFTVWDLIEGKTPILEESVLCEEGKQAANAAWKY